MFEFGEFTAYSLSFGTWASAFGGSGCVLFLGQT